MRFFLGPLLGALVITVAAQSSSRQNLVANLKDKSVAGGCGCYFRFRGTPINADRYMFFSSIEDDEKNAWMNIDGRDVKLRLSKEMDPNRKERVGMRSKRKYLADDISVDATYVVTRVCRGNDENCESTGYSATFVVRKGAKSQLVKAVGSCGC